MNSKQSVPEEQVSTAEDINITVADETVDFSDEEAQLAAEAPEYDLTDDHVEVDQVMDSTSTIDCAGEGDYSLLSQQELIEEFAKLLESKQVQNLRRDVDAIKIAFYKLHRTEVERLRKAFTDGGGNPEEFLPEVNASELRLKELFAEYRKRRDVYIASQEQRKEDNLKVKQKIIDDLKELISSGETLNTTFIAFRDLQNRWKETGLVPQSNMKDLWETYNLYVENFYNVIKINKELRDLDLKRNYETKINLCEEAEALVMEPSVVNAFHKLQKLHEQWREAGPVPNEYKESIWDRFKEASSRINKQHQDYFEGLKGDQQTNFEMKTQLCVKAEDLSQGVYTSRKDWNKASEQLVEIQKVWKTIGFAPKKENAKVYERFRNACDKLFVAKRNFYLHAKSEMDESMKIKNEICVLADSLKESEDWKATTEELISLQNRWKEVGAVPHRYSDTLWKRFRASCDYFFERKTAHFSTMDNEHETNLVAKRAILAEIEAVDAADYTFDKIKEFQRRWGEIGFVPIKQKDAIQSRYKEVMDKLFGALRGNEKDRRMDSFKGKVDGLKKGGDKRLKYERERLYNKVRQMEADIALLENNIGFFSKSKNAESLIKEVQDKITKAKQEMLATIEMVKIIDKQDKQDQ